VRDHTPDPGEHTEAVLAELGYSPDDVADLRARGVV
jgi:crotonobetainyl-CoA:carnitine CoA-transferase CaiB-like acyl-CoA transferase